MMNSEFEFIRTLVYSKSRIKLSPDKRELVSARLGKRLRATNMASVGEYCELLKSGRNQNELTQLIDAISTNHTFFFREIAHFDFVQRTIVPEMLERSKKERWPRFNAWSAACSSGEEPFTLSIVLSECLGAKWPWHIQATDISHRILDKAKAAIYREEALEHVSQPRVRTHFQKGVGPEEGNYRVRANLRSTISFHHLNLLEGELPFADQFHVIFCRNVMIYFDRQTQEELVVRLTRRLVPGGYLLVGHSESLTGITHSLHQVQPSVYRKTLKA